MCPTSGVGSSDKPASCARSAKRAIAARAAPSTAGGCGIMVGANANMRRQSSPASASARSSCCTVASSKRSHMRGPPARDQ